MNANNIDIHQMDVNMAFLNTPLSDEIYITQLQGFINKTHLNHICCLYKSLYGLKQSPYEWNKTFNNHLHTSGFKPSSANPCIYIQWTAEHIAIMAIYINDCTIIMHTKLLKDIKMMLTNQFQMKDLREVNSVLGIEIHHDQQLRCLSIRQLSKVNNILTTFRMHNCKPIAMPMVPGLNLQKLATTIEEDLQLPYQ